jgi:CRP-like cAMP-binding protein
LWLTYNRDRHHSLRFVGDVRYRRGKRNFFLSTQPTPNKLSAELLQVLRENKPSQRFAVGALLFQEGTPATGEVQILLPAGHRERQLLEVAGPGTLLGLSEAMNGKRPRITAIAGDETTVISTPREEFLGHLPTTGRFQPGDRADAKRRFARALPQIQEHLRASRTSTAARASTNS